MNILYGIHNTYPLIFYALAIYIPLAIFWHITSRKASLQEPEIVRDIQPLPISLRFSDYLKAFISWIFLFNRLFYINPGLYFTGTRDENAPLLVTCNNFLTVFLLARRIADRRVRLLILDTHGINVWCSAGEGKFSATEIIEKSRLTGILREGQKIVMILPKLCLSGVKLSDLRAAGIQPVIGPMYAKDLPEYLDKGTFEERVDDRFQFGLQSRTFTALPTAVQFFYWFLGVYVFTFWFLESAIIWVAAGLAFLYPILFPYLPGRQFAVKGVSLGFPVSILGAGLLLASGSELDTALFWILFVIATTIFIALSYTGNSPVSNYESVRKETARFLPVVVILYLLIIPVRLLL